jgi:hypothetical protein
MSDDELRDWIEACHQMENWVRAAKARRGWRICGIEAKQELAHRNPDSDDD